MERHSEGGATSASFKYETPRVLFNKSDEARTRYSDWDVFMPELVCQCAEAAKKEKFTHFAVRDLGVCISSATVSEYYNEVRVLVLISIKMSLDKKEVFIYCYCQDNY